MTRGALTVYLGAAPGVGKTYAMLDEAHRRRSRGSDVVVGLVETHGRPHTAELLDGLEIAPSRTVEYRGTNFSELDVGWLLSRKPQVALVDELAHSIPGARAGGNTKRWQDVADLLDAGIDVISSVSVEHLDSMNDVVAEITGVRQLETIPDDVVRAADQIELVDLSPEALRKRLTHGNVYPLDQADRALTNYFRVGNLGALRELALLWLADRVDAGLSSYRSKHGIEKPWPARERVVVALSGRPEGETLLRRGARIAQRGVGGELIAVHVVTHEQARRANLPRRRDLLSRRRKLLGWIAAVLAPPMLVVLESLPALSVGLTTDALLSLAATVGVALIGGLWPAIVAAVWGFLLLNWFRTPPVHTFTIAAPENAVALVITVVVGAAVASVVDTAARRSQQARRANAEAETLSTLAGSVIRGQDTVAAILTQLRSTFDLDSVTLLERKDDRSPWQIVEHSGDPATQVPAEADSEIRISPTLGLAIRGADLDAGSRRVLEAFAAQTSVILERERLQQRAEEARKLQAGDAMRRTLLAAVSHDLRTPLASIKASVTSLQQNDVDFSPEDRDQLLDMVQHATVRLERIVNNLLDLSRLQSGTARPLSQATSIDEIVWPALADVPHERLTVDVDETLPLLHTDPGLVERALENIVQNAVNYAPGNITITAELVRGRSDQPLMEIRVIDHGPGVPDQVKEQIFDSFQQVGDHRQNTGLGLGLAVARGFAEAVGGSLVARDTPGGGLTMALTLPVGLSDESTDIGDGVRDQWVRPAGNALITQRMNAALGGDSS